jgi:hypothetical protein
VYLAVLAIGGNQDGPLASHLKASLQQAGHTRALGFSVEHAAAIRAAPDDDQHFLLGKCRRQPLRRGRLQTGGTQSQ